MILFNYQRYKKRNMKIYLIKYKIYSWNITVSKGWFLTIRYVQNVIKKKRYILERTTPVIYKVQRFQNQMTFWTVFSSSVYSRSTQWFRFIEQTKSRKFLCALFDFKKRTELERRLSRGFEFSFSSWLSWILTHIKLGTKFNLDFYLGKITFTILNLSYKRMYRMF